MGSVRRSSMRWESAWQVFLEEGPQVQGVVGVEDEWEVGEEAWQWQSESSSSSSSYSSRSLSSSMTSMTGPRLRLPVVVGVGAFLPCPF